MPSASSLCLALTLPLCLLSTACKVSAVTSPIEEVSPPMVFAEAQSPAKRDEPAVVEVTGITEGECPSDTSDYPVTYFEDQVLIRLPKGVTEDNFVEFQPGFARIASAVESTNCISGMPGAMINFMALVMMVDDPARPLDDLRDEMLQTLGYPREITLVEMSEPGSKRAGMWVYEVPPTDASPEPAKILLSMLAGHGNMSVVIYEVHPNAWSVIVNTLVGSARRVLLLSS